MPDIRRPLQLLNRLVVLAALSLVSVSVTGEEMQVWPSRGGNFSLSFESELQPLVINRIHSWIITINDESGAAIEGAELRVIGGMPAHDHGLPTEPRMTRELGAGRYRVEGMRFHMNGAWVVEITIDASGIRDTVAIPLTL